MHAIGGTLVGLQKQKKTKKVLHGSCTEPIIHNVILEYNDLFLEALGCRQWSVISSLCMCVWRQEVQRTVKATGCGFSGLLTVNPNYTVLHYTEDWSRAERTSPVMVNRWDRGGRQGGMSCVCWRGVREGQFISVSPGRMDEILQLLRLQMQHVALCGYYWSVRKYSS